MRVIALLSLLLGFMGILFLDGQTFTHAVMGILFGIAAAACGLGSARRDRSSAACRFEGRLMATLGLLLAVYCVIQLPSAYKFQKTFNRRSQQSRMMEEQKRMSTTNHEPTKAPN